MIKQTDLNNGMANKDWKDQLGNLITPNQPLSPEESHKSTPSEETLVNPQQLILRFEKRSGKPATIVSNFQGTAKELDALASQLKKHCSAGGSAKDDEILIQGDVRTKVAAYLRKMGHKIRGDFA